MNKNIQSMIADLYYSSEEAQSLSSDPEILGFVNEQKGILSAYRKEAARIKADRFKSKINSTIIKEWSAEEISKRFQRLIDGLHGEGLKKRGLGFCRNSSTDDLSINEKKDILEKLGLLEE